MQLMCLYVIYEEQVDKTFEDAHWGLIKQMQQRQYRILSTCQARYLKKRLKTKNGQYISCVTVHIFIFSLNISVQNPINISHINIRLSWWLRRRRRGNGRSDLNIYSTLPHNQTCTTPCFTYFT